MAGPYLTPMTTTVEERDRAADLALLPVGSFEQHGPYLPLATDTVIACAVAGELAPAREALVLPPVTVSCSHEHAAWPGTVSVSAATLYAVVTDIAASLRRSGIGRLVLVSGHGGNHVLANVVQESYGAMALFPGFADWEAARAAAGIGTTNDADMHAGELETSILLHTHPDLVRPGYETADHSTGERREFGTLGMAPYTESGVIGRPSLATAEKGRDVLAALVTLFAGHLSALDAPGAAAPRSPAGG